MSWSGIALNVAELVDGGDHGAMRITAPIRLEPAAIRAREPHFPLFLMAALLPLLLFLHLLQLQFQLLRKLQLRPLLMHIVKER